MTRLQMQPGAHRLPDLCSERLRLVRPRVGVEVDEHVIALNCDGEVALGKLEAGGALQVDVAPRLGQKALAHEHHRAVLKGRDARPLQWRLLEEGVADLRDRRRLQVGHTPLDTPLGHRLLDLPLPLPLVGHNLPDHPLCEIAVHLGVGQQQCDLLLAHDRPGQLLDAIELVKVDGHRKHEDAARVIDLLGATARHKVLDVEEDAQTRADLAAALLD
eukprot:1954489-Prymnesium_polylepis.3